MMRHNKNARMAIDVNVKQLKDKSIGELYIYDEIKADGFDFWSGEIIESDTSAKAIQKKLAALGNISELNVYIASNGGSVKEGLAIYSQIARMECPKTAYIDGIAASIATVIACACDKIKMNSTSLFFIHNAWSYAQGNAKELRAAADDLDTITSASKKAYLNKSNGKISEEKLTELMDAETWLTAEQCVDYGFCDEITDVKASGEDIPDGYKQALVNGASMRAPEDGIMAAIGKLTERIEQLEAKQTAAETEESEEKKTETDTEGNTAPRERAETPETDKKELTRKAAMSAMSAMFEAIAKI